MSSPEDIQEWIDKYLNDELSSDEKIQFQNRLETDSEFANIFEIQRISYQIVLGKNLLELKTRMQKDLDSKNPYVTSKGWKAISTGALIVMILALIYFFWTQEKKHPSIHTNKSLKQDSAVISEEKIEADTIERIKPEERKEQKIVQGNSENAIHSCKDSLISFSCQARGACLEQHNGAIEIDLNTVKNGKAPFQFSIYPDKNFNPESEIGNLKTGKYDLYIKDAEGCIRRLNIKIEVPVVDCGR